MYNEADSTTSWNNFDLRMYDARFGRWISPDPYGQYASPYLAMGNNPVSGVDPDGGWNWAAAGIGFAIGAGIGYATTGDWRVGLASGIGAGVLAGASFKGSGKGNVNFKFDGDGSSPFSRYSTPKLTNFGKLALPVGDALVRTSINNLVGTYSRPSDFPTKDFISNSRIQDLHPRLGTAARQFINAVDDELGIQLRVSQGYRSIAEQNALYNQGRTTPGEIVTNARGGDSYHNYGSAFDVVQMINGQAFWMTTPEDWTRIGSIGQRYGLEWGGNWKRFKDRPHFEMSLGRSVKQLKQIHGVSINPLR